MRSCEHISSVLAKSITGALVESSPSSSGFLLILYHCCEIFPLTKEENQCRKDQPIGWDFALIVQIYDSYWGQVHQVAANAWTSHLSNTMRNNIIL